MFVFYEEDGGFKAGAVLADQNTSLQVETQHGKRAKVKATAVLLRFERPSLNEFMDAAKQLADDIDAAFLWECCGQDEFSFDHLAKDYFGRAPLPHEAAAVLMKLHGTPTHFYKKGKGRYKPAPPDALKSALASIERKRLQAAQQARYQEQLARKELPEEFRPLLDQLLYQPDKGSIEFKALEAACASVHLTAPRLLEQCGALPSAHDFHLRRFLFEQFPQGTGFAPGLSAQTVAALPLAEVRAFSIDDAATSEIDDAFSVRTLPSGNIQVGIHIAAPALGCAPGSALDEAACRRQSTVYMPGAKITMLPDAVIEQFSLAAAHTPPVLSLYLELTQELAIVSQRSVVEAVPIVANLRHETLELDFNEAALAGGRTDFRFGEELTLLWRFARKLEAARSQSENATARADYNFLVEGERIRIIERKRGSPIDKVVSELMILVNTQWGGLLAAKQVSGIYRAQAGGKVKMSTIPARHEGLGVPQYAWSSSPLRRYVDLVNQRQLIALLREVTAPYDGDREQLLTIMRDFDAAYDAYAEFQRNMERFWCLRWLQQEGVSETSGEIVRDNLVRVDQLPLVTKVLSVPELIPGSRIRLRIEAIDFLAVELQSQFLGVDAPADTPQAM